MVGTPDPYGDFVLEDEVAEAVDYSLGEYEADTSYSEGSAKPSGGYQTADTLEPAVVPLRVRFAARAGEQ